MIDWLFTTALAALALALVVAVFVWTFRPSPAVRHALWLIVVLKLISPTGLVVSVPLPVDRPVANGQRWPDRNHRECGQRSQQGDPGRERV